MDYPTPEWDTYSAGVSVHGTIISHCNRPVSATINYKVFIEDADGKHVIGTGSAEEGLQPGEAKDVNIRAPVAEWIQKKYPSGYWDVSHSVTVR
ncbi:hypothetical protein NE850_29315 [Paraburkholderia sp. USG1]|uniref:hypothetical protein n=1 Tax=Paraburkholderia sp. USG1 TaxID=2952268 RepID=UPI002863E39A|nr:hypothetical protein [Paraburkholderia sp. USG1]MDR8400416.1 hypothetical protein [Paraburkholderia sp. USG1]